MIRLPPSSIGLSQRDIDFHFREIQIKEQLYAQGFTKEEVQRYYRECHGSSDSFDPINDEAVSAQTPAVESAPSKRRVIASDTVLLAEEKDPSSETASARTVSSNENSQGSQNAPTIQSDPVSSSPMSIPSSSPGMHISLPNRHAAVRQSSQLRIVHTPGSYPSPASPSFTTSSSSSSSNVQRNDDDAQDERDAGTPDYMPSSAVRLRSYRPRSKTYTYTESEAEPPTPSKSPTNEMGSSPPRRTPTEPAVFDAMGQFAQRLPRFLVAKSSTSAPDAEISSPLTLPPPLSISRRTSSLRSLLPDRTSPSGLITISQRGTSTDLPATYDGLDTSRVNDPSTTPSLPLISSTGLSNSSTQERNGGIETVSGHYPITPTRADATFTQPSPAFLASPALPPQLLLRTEPRRPRGLFGVYNDTLPTEKQPQTPMDLLSPRRTFIPERAVAYTMPPGQVRRVGRLVGSGQDEGEVGLGSPAGMSARIMEQRAREWGRWRGVRMETLRHAAERHRRMEIEHGSGSASEEERFGEESGMVTGEAATLELTRQRLDGMDLEDESAEGRLMSEWAQLDTFERVRRVQEVDWRDELDEDRIGEENFETPGRRVVGGRQRVRGTNHAEDDGEGVDLRAAILDSTP